MPRKKKEKAFDVIAAKDSVYLQAPADGKPAWMQDPALLPKRPPTKDGRPFVPRRDVG